MKSKYRILSDKFNTHSFTECFRIFYKPIRKRSRVLPSKGGYDYYWALSYSYDDLKVIAKVTNEGDGFRRVVLGLRDKFDTYL